MPNTDTLDLTVDDLPASDPTGYPEVSGFADLRSRARLLASETLVMWPDRLERLGFLRRAHTELAAATADYRRRCLPFEAQRFSELSCVYRLAIRTLLDDIRNDKTVGV